MNSTMMVKGTLDALATIAFLVEAMPILKGKSKEAASLVEEAIHECIQAVATRQPQPVGPIDIAWHLSHVLVDVTHISRSGAVLLKSAIGILQEREPTVVKATPSTH